MNPVSSTLHQTITSVPDAMRDSRIQTAKNNFQTSIATNSFPREDVRPPAMKLMKQVAITVQSPNATTATTTRFHPMYHFEAFTGPNGAWIYDCLFTEYRIVTLCKDDHQELMDEQEEKNNQETGAQSESPVSTSSTNSSSLSSK